MPFSKAIKEKAAVACNRSCCLCHKFKGTKLEFHHIKQEADGGENTFENCIPLCFDCHADMGGVNPKHPKGNAYSENELRMHRDKWYEQCSPKVNFTRAITNEEIDRIINNNLFEPNNPSITENQKRHLGTKNRGQSVFDYSKNNTVSVEIRNVAGGHTVIIDDEKYIAERIIEEHDREIERLLKEI